MSSSGSPGNKFADYFVICGLEPSCGLEPDKLSGDSLHIQPLDRPYKSHVLAHYPDNVPWNPFDKEAVGMLCCPRGIAFRTQKQQRRPSFHSFLITREDGSRIHGAAYTFYEEVSNHQICAAMQTLHAMHLAELSNSQSRTLYSHLGPAHERSPVQGRRRGTYQTYDISQDKLYSTKCICLISQLPLVSAMRKFLTSLYSISQNFTAPDLPLECYVYNVLHEVPMPPPGRSLKFTCCARDIMCQRPGVDEMPLLDMPIGEIFRMLGIKNVLAIFTCILLEHQILLYSSNYHYLMLVAEGLTSLVFPFSWQHVYVPILPASLLHFLDAPVPFIMGLHHGLEERSDLALPSEANMCFVDIDTGTVELPEDLPTFPQLSDFIEELQSVLSKIGSRYESKDSVFHEDFDSGMSDGSVSSSLTSIPNKMEILAQSEAFTKITAIAKKSGVINSIEDIELNLDSNKSSKRNSRNDEMDETSRELEELKFNNAIRQVFLNRFLHIFCHYEHFVIQPVGQSVESWLGNRESMQNFDKASFLSDQPDTHLPFLAAFIETQMFATLIDNKILSMWEEPDLALKIFDDRVKTISEREEGRTPVYHRCLSYENSEGVIEKRFHKIDHIANLPHQLEFMNETRQHQRGVFPILQADVLNREPVSNKTKKHENIKWRKKERQAQHVEHVGLKAAQREKFIQEAKCRRVRESKLFDTNPTMVARTNWKFVETLLKECKNKTKRMLVEKMGQEAVDLGHGELSITGVEENTLIASLCDLLERIWSHGLQSKQGKSALWSHLLSYKEVEESHDTSKAIDPSTLTPDLSTGLESSSPLSSPSKTRHRRKNSQSINLPTLPPLATSLTADMRNVEGMSNVITEAGYARAWIRLSLEKKVLSKHLKELLSDLDLTRSLYKRYAFLRCEDEKEQFLYHMLSLNAVDYKCFTSTFTSTIIPYRVLVFPAKRIGGSICGTTANPWITVAGQLGESPVTVIPKTSWELLLECKNLGMLTTLRIGHDNSGIAPRWLVEHVLIRNEVTGHTYKFPCGRWLGKGVDDGSTERLLVGELVSVTTDTEDLLTTCSTPPRCGSPSTPKKCLDGKLTINRIQEMVGDSINSLVKHFYKPEKERGSLTVLLCGETGIVTCMEHVFQYNFKSSRILRSKFYLWDYIEKVQGYFETLLKEDHRIPVEIKSVYKSFCYLVTKINNSTQNIGKDGKFQLLMCLSIRDNLLQGWIPAMTDTPVTLTMYEEMSFLRDPELTTFLVHILESLKEFNITLEASLTKGIGV